MLHIPIVHTHDISKQIPQEKNSLCDFLLWDFTIKKLVETYVSEYLYHKSMFEIFFCVDKVKIFRNLAMPS